MYNPFYNLIKHIYFAHLKKFRYLSIFALSTQNSKGFISFLTKFSIHGISHMVKKKLLTIYKGSASHLLISTNFSLRYLICVLLNTQTQKIEFL